MHGLCPKGPDTWCKYNRQLECPTDLPYNHKNNIPEAIMRVIKPIFRDLSNPNLLKKCTHGKAQNGNESVNSVIRIPKNVFVTLKTLELGVYDAITCFNKGNIMKCEVLEKLGMKPGYFMVAAMEALDLSLIHI